MLPLTLPEINKSTDYFLSEAISVENINVIKRIITTALNNLKMKSDNIKVLIGENVL